MTNNKRTVLQMERQDELMIFKRPLCQWEKGDPTASKVTLWPICEFYFPGDLQMGRARLWRITKEPGFTNGTGQFVLRLCRISRVFGLFLQMEQSRLFLCTVCELVSIALTSRGIQPVGGARVCPQIESIELSK